MSERDTFIRDLTDFIFVDDAPEQADVILICGSSRKAPAIRAAALYHEGWSDRILPTGRFGHNFPDFRAEMRRLSENDGRDPDRVIDEISAEAVRAGKPFPLTEWEYQRIQLLLAGVPEQAVLREDQSTNTFENAVFAREVLAREGIQPRTMILCCQAFHARRALWTIGSEFPDTRILTCPADTRGYTKDNWFRTKDGYDKILDELRKCGSYFHGEQMYDKIISPG
ncbi:MAG: YdcF family protein [Lachnospiraceae bacterium]|nr:YdcF family protein [Lachnospiraceae bacterium]